MDLTTSAQKVAEDTWGFVPNRQVKPVHMANGLFRELMQQRGSPGLLQKAAGGFLSGRTKITTEQLRQDLLDHVIASGGDGEIDFNRLEGLRAALDVVLNQDRAFFGNGPFTPTLTHHLQVTGDPSDRGTGRFLAHVLLGGSPKMVKALSKVLQDETDDVFLLTAPLLKERDAGLLPDPDPNISNLVSRSPILKSVQQAFDTLALHADRLDKTSFLQRTVTLACFALHLHLVNASGKRDAWNPLLLCAPDPSSEIREASRATLRRAMQEVVRAFEEGVVREYKKSGEDDKDGDGYKTMFRQYVEVDKTAGRRRFEQFCQDFDVESAAAEDPFHAFARAFTQSAFADLGSSAPIDFTKDIGRLAGLVFPRGAGRGDKYYCPAPQFIDALVPSLIEPDDTLTVDDFWHLAWERFGLVSGTLANQDATRLRAWGIPSLSAQHLQENGQRLLNEMVKVGYARVYADGMAIVSPMLSQQ